MSGSRLFGVLGALLGFLAVAGGALGPHSLKAVLKPEALAAFETGVRYQMYHALALLLAAQQPAGALEQPWSRWAGWAFIIGILLFSGSLYLVSLAGVRWMGAVTPLGGLAFLIGWSCLTMGYVKRK